jgi:prolyl oligopeptidase
MMVRILCAAIFPFLLAALAEAAPPPSPVQIVNDEYQGVKVADPYRWLEKAEDPAVQEWTKNQAASARTFLDALPHLADFQAKLEKWNNFQSSSYRGLRFRGGRYFVLRLSPPKSQPELIVLSSLENVKSARILVDPIALDAGGTTAIDFYEPSLDGKYVAVSLSKGGSEIGDVHFYSVADGKELPGVLPSVNRPTGGGSVAWNADASGVYYTRYPHEGEKPKADLDFFQQVFFHKLGTDPKTDVYSIGKEFPRIAEIRLDSSLDGKYLLATVANGDGGEFAHYVLPRGGEWKQLTRFEDKITQGELGHHDDLYLVSLKDSPKGKVLRLDLKDPSLAKAPVVVAENEFVIDRVLPTPNALFLGYLAGGPSELREFALDGAPKKKIAIPAASSVGGLTETGDGIAFSSQSYTQPPVWYTYAPRRGMKKTALEKKSPVSFADVQIERDFAVSKDGTKVPLTILFKKGVKRNGANPALLYGYGGYGISMEPYFRADLHLWLEHGGVYAVANLRGGGEFGEAWHKAGNLTKKQNVFDDFVACAQRLIELKYTSPAHLAIEGGSNGGLLMGAALTQHPELFRAAVSHVGIYDMLRVETDANGAFNVTEFGSVKDPEQFKALYAYSPYHHVAEGTQYPATLLLTGANDGRVNPYHSKKMAARMQAVSKDRPVLLRVTFDGGHGIGSSIKQRVSEEADVYAFLFSQLGMTY